MTVLERSSIAQDHNLGEWYHQIEMGHVKLPRFQRFEAWDRSRITSFLNSMIHNLPVGVTLVLEVAGREQFDSRYIVSAEPKNENAVIQHLLDGQQRLTAFWRSMNNNYERETYFVYLPEFNLSETTKFEDIDVFCERRWYGRNEIRYPKWADEPKKCLDRGLLPIDLLCPTEMSIKVDEWVENGICHLKPNENEPDAIQKMTEYSEKKIRLKDWINQLRERVKYFNLPFLKLPANTPKDVALQVFINMNTNSKPLSLYDITVAEVEGATGTSLHDLEKQLISNCPKVERYGTVSDLILATSALLQEKTPSLRGMLEMDKKILVDKWSDLEDGLKRMATFLENEGILDHARLPTNSVLAVIAAAYDVVPKDGDFVAKAEKLLRAYLWSSFFTDRYENTTVSRAYADFKGVKDKHRGIKDLLSSRNYDEQDFSEIPVLNRSEHALADENELISAGWPKKSGILARGVLAVSNYFGARDFADSSELSFESLQNREYHHIFPDALLSEAEIDSNHALNCVLLTWKTNRIIGRKDPLEYLKERVKWADEETVSDRLKTHLVSYELLRTACYQNNEGRDLEGEELRSKLEPEFNEFKRIRAKHILRAVNQLTRGEQPSLESIWND